MVDVEDLMAWRNGVLLRNIMVVHWVFRGWRSMVEEQGAVAAVLAEMSKKLFVNCQLAIL